jgi:hypothetical protein
MTQKAKTPRKGRTPGAGRAPRTDNPQRLVVLVPGELKRWLQHAAIDRAADMGDIVTLALEDFRKKHG